jgi:hypothetical protein
MILDPAAWSNAKAHASAENAARLAAVRDTNGRGMEAFAWDAAYYSAGAAAWKTVSAARSAADASSWASSWNKVEADEYRLQVWLLHDILGNPFRSATLAPSSRTPDVNTLAGHVYQDRAFSHLLEMADALEEAGCTDADIVAHCRGDGPHIRGCWVVDLVLGKE